MYLICANHDVVLNNSLHPHSAMNNPEDLHENFRFLVYITYVQV